MIIKKSVDTLDYDEAIQMLIDYRLMFGFKLGTPKDALHFVSWFKNALILRLNEQSSNYLSSSIVKRDNIQNAVDMKDWECVVVFLRSYVNDPYACLDNEYGIDIFTENLEDWIIGFSELRNGEFLSKFLEDGKRHASFDFTLDNEVEDFCGFVRFLLQSEMKKYMY